MDSYDDSDDESKKVKLPEHKILHNDMAEHRHVNKIVECKCFR
jgi:hypothetical protein